MARALMSLAGLLVTAGMSWSDDYVIDSKSRWQEWEFPAGTLELRTDGSIVPKRFTGPINAALDAGQFEHKTAQGTARGGIWKATSNLGRARSIIDGNPRSFWQPDADDELGEWQVEIDLGRAVPVTHIRLIFPDRAGARPFREFRVFGSMGVRVLARGGDVFSFGLIGGTTRPNFDTEVEFAVKPFLSRQTLVLGGGDTGGDPLEIAEGVAEAADAPGSVGRLLEDEVADESLPAALLQYIRFRADTKSPDAALAEVEVYTYGENVALGTLERGGSVIERVGNGTDMLDGDANTSWLARGSVEDPTPSWTWDLGVVYWVKRVSLFGKEEANVYSKVRGIQNHRFMASDGRQTLAGETSFDRLVDFDLDFGHPGQLTYLFVPPRRIRFLSSIYAFSANCPPSCGQSGEIREVMVYPVGHVSQVELISDNIDLGAIAGDRRPKVIESIDWKADLPPGTRVQAKTRSGNTLGPVTHYFHRSGEEISKETFDGLPKPLRGEKEVRIEQGEDWSNWTTPYLVPGAFRSPSPRRYVQLGLLLSSDRIAAAPTVSSFTVRFTSALLSKAAGEIFPKTADFGVAQSFSYRIRPKVSPGDGGFNRILFEIPSPVDTSAVSVRIGEDLVQPTTVRIASDSLLIDLRSTVQTDSVTVDFPLVLRRNPTLFTAFVAHTSRPGFWQQVDPADRFATAVFLPQVTDSHQLIRDLSIRPPLLTPNGDGVGDRVEIRLSTAKVLTAADTQLPSVRIYALDGRLIRELAGRRMDNLSLVYEWDGAAQHGGLVGPGIYMCEVRLKAQIRDERAVRVINVTY